MAETACLTPYTSKSMTPSTRDLPPFSNPSPLHGYVNGSLSSYTFNGGGGGGSSTPTPKTSPLQTTSNGVVASNGINTHHNREVIQGVAPSVISNYGINTPHNREVIQGVPPSVISNGINTPHNREVIQGVPPSVISNGIINTPHNREVIQGVPPSVISNGINTPHNREIIQGVAPSVISNGINSPHREIIQGVPPSVYMNYGGSLAHANPLRGVANISNNINEFPLVNYGLNCSIKGSISSNEQVNGSPSPQAEVPSPRRPSLWYEEEIDENLRWSFGLTSILHTGVSKFQEIALLDTQPFGKVLTLDRKMQSAERDEWVYHECLVHPALLLHQSPKSIYIMGGGEGSTAREALRHRSVRKVVMCDIDEEVVKFCSAHLTMNREAFESNRLELVINDAKAELESREECFDIIVGDLADPLEWGPCYQLYSKGFYESIVKPKLNHGGILVTQAGPAGILSHKEVFTSIYNTLRHVFSYVVAYSAHVPSYADTWGWVMASDQPFTQIAAIDELDCKIKQRIKGELRYLDGATLHASTILNKTVRQSLADEKHVYTEDSARFVYGHGRSAGAH